MFGALLPAGTTGLGARNVAAAREACLAAEVPVVAELTGGESGRSVFFDVQSGRLQVRTVWGDNVVL
jgi:chemotaxis receptor (MCP) glutamine deamidase CheD